jgi:hypothetical protein
MDSGGSACDTETGVTVRQVELGKGVFRESQFAAIDDGCIVDHVQRGQDVPPVGPDLDFGERLKTLGAVYPAVAVEVGDVLAVSVDCDPAQHQVRGEVVVAVIRIGRQCCNGDWAHGCSLHRNGSRRAMSEIRYSDGMSACILRLA